MENGEWRMENGKWRMENGKWRMENGEWEMENCLPSEKPGQADFSGGIINYHACAVSPTSVSSAQCQHG
ncbi:MAG TPA: hypothetical protein ENJ20_04250 [Bacteroidetes bacterium]|nr:hypothetical protein [Bacteroidota bacterium]